MLVALPGIKARSLVFTSLGHFINDGNFLMFSLLLVYYKEISQINIADVAWMAVGYNLISGLTSIGVGYVASRTGEEGPLISIGITLQAISIFMFGLPFAVPDYWFLPVLAGTFFLGFGQSFYHPLGASILRTTYGSIKAPFVMGINGSMGSLGRALMPSVLGFFILFYGNFDGFMLIFAYTIIGSSFILFGLMDYWKYSPARAHPARGNAKESSSERYWKFMVFISAVVFLRSAFLGGAILYISTYLVSVLHSVIEADIFLTLTFIPPIIGQPILGGLTTKRGGRFATNLTGIVSAVMFSLFLLTQIPIMMALAFTVFSFMAFSLFPVMLGYIGQQVKEGQGSFSNSMAWGLGNSLGFSAGAGIMTVWHYTYSIYSGMWLMLALGTVSSVLFFFIKPDLAKPNAA
ncbi:MAG: MFS transporter [Candidatus Thermoplasmatota archaeon]|jgi:MFS family permease|nr:MFS transporter [Candidatus Thermoplasmatota archaeon]